MATTTSKDGRPIAYARSGSGPPLLLVHGTTADQHAAMDTAPELFLSEVLGFLGSNPTTVGDGRAR